MYRQERRAQVLRQAKRLFARKGYHRTNISDIVARSGIARGTFYLYFRNKRDLFEELLERALAELKQRVRRIRMGQLEPSPLDQLRANLSRVVEFVLAERELTDIVLNHATGFDHELDSKIAGFYERIVTQIERSLELGIEMKLVRKCDKRAVAHCILGAVKEIVGQLTLKDLHHSESLVDEILSFGLQGVARPELLVDSKRDVVLSARGQATDAALARQ
jgi:AcrR family transcriptional regulator